MAGTNALVTEFFLAANFSPKPGHTPGSDNGQILDCDAIISRYYVTIQGVTSTGNRCPAQNQLVSSVTLPTVTTNTLTYSNGITASGGGNVTSEGSGTVSARGVCWSISTSSPTTGNTHTTDGSGLGAFSSTLNNLACGVLHYVRAYATSQYGTSYGATQTVTPVDPTVSTTFGVFTSLTDLSGHTYTNGSQGWSASDASTVCSLYSSGQYLNGSVYTTNLLTDTLAVGHYVYAGAGSSYCIYHITGYLVTYPATYNIIGVVDGLITSMNVCPVISTTTTTAAPVCYNLIGDEAYITIAATSTAWCADTTKVAHIMSADTPSVTTATKLYSGSDCTTYASAGYYGISRSGNWRYWNGTAFTSSGTCPATTTTTQAAGYYDCGYGCQYYAYYPGCTPCDPASTTTTTSIPYYGYIVDVYVCGGCTLIESGILVQDTHNFLLLNRYYADSYSGYAYKIVDTDQSLGGLPSYMLGSGATSCAGVACL